MNKAISTRRTATENERGIALVITLFALLLLTVIGLGMMFSTNMETMINANYRDKQIAVYASMSGLQEARDRLQLANPSIPVPTELPTIDNAQVIYIINPRNGEDIEPWNINNKYADTELCQENVIGLSGPRGVPCTTLPAGDDWYTVVDNSDESQAPWNLATPLDVKWTRIMVKSNNMTAVPVNGDAANGNLVCWEGLNQIPRPGGYGPNCAPDGSIASLTLTSAGSGYTSAPNVVIDNSPLGGSNNAEAEVSFTAVPNGQVASITLTTSGSAYTSAPQVVITDATGTGAAAFATIIPTGQSVQTLTFNGGGTKCYAASPTVAISGGGGSGASATVTMGPDTCIASWTPSGSCKDRKGETIQVGVNGGGGAGFLGQLHLQNGNPWSVDSFSIINSGTGYTSVPTSLNFPDCPGVTMTALLGKRVTGTALENGGGGFSSTPTVTYGGVGQGSGDTSPSAAASIGGANPDAGKVISVTVTSPGSGYTAPTVAFSGGTAGSIAAGTVTVGTLTTITGITLTNAGKGYLTDPQVNLVGGGPGTGAQAVAHIARGPNYGRVFLVTTYAETRFGARAMSQMEIASPVLGFAVTGALTLDGPNPVIQDMPNSNNYQIIGTDDSLNSCGEQPEVDHPAIGGYDDPNADPPTDSVNYIISQLPRPDHYLGAGGTPSVVNVFNSLGETMGTPQGLKALIEAIKAVATVYPDGHILSSTEDGEPNSPKIVYVDGDTTFSGNNDGYGIMVVTGKLSFSGNFAYHGLVLAIGDGEIDFDGGGNGKITGSVLVANIWDKTDPDTLLPSLGSPFMDWNGGGGNGIQYDHCWATNLMRNVPFTPPPSTKPLKVLSVRNLP